MSSCSTSRIWAGGHLRASVRSVHNDDVKSLHALAHCLKADSHLLCAHVHVRCLLTSIHQVTGFLHQDGVGRRERRARGMRAVHLQRHLVALLVEGNAGVVAGRVRGIFCRVTTAQPRLTGITQSEMRYISKAIVAYTACTYGSVHVDNLYCELAARAVEKVCPKVLCQGRQAASGKTEKPHTRPEIIHNKFINARKKNAPVRPLCAMWGGGPERDLRWWGTIVCAQVIYVNENLKTQLAESLIDMGFKMKMKSSSCSSAMAILPPAPHPIRRTRDQGSSDCDSQESNAGSWFHAAPPAPKPKPVSGGASVQHRAGGFSRTTFSVMNSAQTQAERPWPGVAALPAGGEVDEAGAK
eukprot:scaffold5473_cov147-Isochrysis_galbana.AAC.2